MIHKNDYLTNFKLKLGGQSVFGPKNNIKNFGDNIFLTGGRGTGCTNYIVTPTLELG